MKRILSAVLLLSAFALCAIAPAFASNDEGTLIESTAGLKKGAHAVARADAEKEFTFKGKDVDLSVPYTQIRRLEYGLKSHMAVGYSLVMGVHPKKVKENLFTMEYTDANEKPQTLVMKLGKDKIFTTLINLQNKSGKRIEFGDEKARKEAMAQAPPGQVF